MTRKDKRDLVLSMCLGDGCLAYTSNRRSAAITIAHCTQQEDYLKFKADMLGIAFNRNIVVRKNACQLNIRQISVCVKRFKAWRKFIYQNNKKDIAKILPFIQNKYRAVAIWLMDDGYVEPNIRVRVDGSIGYGSCFRIFTCDQTLKTHEFISDWFYKEFDIKIKIKYSKKQNTYYPFIKMTGADSLKLWEHIRDFILIHESMRHKFRHIESSYQIYRSQRATLDVKV